MGLEFGDVFFFSMKQCSGSIWVHSLFVIMFYLCIKHIWMSRHPECQWKANTSSDPLLEKCDDFFLSLNIVIWNRVLCSRLRGIVSCWHRCDWPSSCKLWTSMDRYTSVETTWNDVTTCWTAVQFSGSEASYNPNVEFKYLLKETHSNKMKL